MLPFKNPPDTLVVHCTASPNGKPLSVAQIRAEHINGRGFSDIGYHWVIGIDGVCYPGRSTQFTGAGVEGENSHTLHVSMVGTDKFTKAQWETLAAHVIKVMNDWPTIKNLKGHRDFSPDLNHNGKIEPNEWIKLCPSFDVKSWAAAGMQPLTNQTL